MNRLRLFLQVIFVCDYTTKAWNFDIRAFVMLWNLMCGSTINKTQTGLQLQVVDGWWLK